MWNLPASYKAGDYFKGGLDDTCATSTAAGIVAWCTWMRWNLPGPLGANPFPKAPSVGGLTVPLFIAQGSADDIIHCVAPAGTPTADVPGPADCMSRALYESLATVYCPSSGPQGHLELNTVRHVELESPATHFSIPGEISAKGLSKSASDLVFTGSPLQQFMTSAFERSAAPGCTTRVINPTAS